MKLSQVKPISEESTVIDLRNSKEIDQLAHSLHDKHFPKSFHVTVKTTEGNVVLGFELSEKKLNDQKNYHVIMFVYELDSKTSKKVHDMLTKAESDDEKYDRLSSELGVDTIEIYAEFGKNIDKVWGHAR